jgi:hypothetical protein
LNHDEWSEKLAKISAAERENDCSLTRPESDAMIELVMDLGLGLRVINVFIFNALRALADDYAEFATFLDCRPSNKLGLSR